MIRKFLASSSRAAHSLSCVPLIILIAITSADVVARYAFNSSVPDTAEISAMMLGVAISLALPVTTHGDEQVKFGVFVDRMPAGIKRWARIVSLFVPTVLFALIAWGAFVRVSNSYLGGEYIGALEIPIWPAKLVFAVACLLTAMVLLVQLVSTTCTPARHQTGASVHGSGTGRG